MIRRVKGHGLDACEMCFEASLWEFHFLSGPLWDTQTKNGLLAILYNYLEGRQHASLRGPRTTLHTDIEHKRL